LSRLLPALYADPNNRDLVATENRMHVSRIAKAIGAAEEPLRTAEALRRIYATARGPVVTVDFAVLPWIGGL
jgi:hypothetical protein